MGHDALHRAFRQVRTLFFPRWDRRGLWRLDVHDGLTCFGCCNFETKIISIRALPVGDGLRLLLIHEICHCCSEKSHGKKWQGRMLLAAERALTLGMDDLANMLKDEAATAGGAGTRIRAEAVYAAIRSCAADFPTASFDEIKGMVCRRLGLCREEFEKTYRRAHKFFEKKA